MAILHGSWLPTFPDPEMLPADAIFPPQTAGCFFIWGETWRSSPQVKGQRGYDIQDHPFVMNLGELVKFLEARHPAIDAQLSQAMQMGAVGSSSTKTARNRTKPQDAPIPVQWQDVIVTLPMRADKPGLPYHSATPLDPENPHYLQPFRVVGFSLTPDIAVELLTHLPLSTGLEEETTLGVDLRFWSHITRWSLDLLARSKFLPVLSAASPNTPVAQWLPLIDSSTDQARFKQFSQTMPMVCRFYQGLAASNGKLKIDLPPKPGHLLDAFLQQLVDRQLRQTFDPELIQTLQKQGVDPAFCQWVKALVTKSPTLTGADTVNEQLAPTLSSWTQPIQQSLQHQQTLRICFNLQPPVIHSTTWTLEYGLQALDDPSYLLMANTIWGTSDDELNYLGRTIERPQETLLMGLGLASRVYPLLEESLQGARPTQSPLTPMQAYEFLKAAVWRLEDSGFGVILPPSLSHRDGLANRLGLQIKAQTGNRAKAGVIGLESLLKFQWELAIGGQTLTKEEFDQLVAQDSPLVEINGEWVELRPQDVRSAQTFFASRQDQTGLTLQDALRISTGDSVTLEKLPVVGFEASGPLQSLLNTLSGNCTIEAIAEPQGFKGELRPYQARGVGWLSFLEQWGLGACLADDMGLGKTIQFIAFLLSLKAEEKLSGPALLICPTSVLGNWEREVHRFGPPLKTLVHHGPGRAKGGALAKVVKTKDLVITSYALLYRDEKALKAIEWWGVALDEAQNIKNPEARQSKAARNLQAHCRIALTGTPLENRLTELWSILDFLNPGYLGPRPFFQRRFATPIERYGDTASLTTLRSLVQPFILRRTKTDRTIIQDLPDKQEMDVFCSLTPEQAALYEKIVQESLEAVEAAKGIQRHGIILATLMKLKQICNHPAQYLKEETLRSPKQRSGKLKRLEEMLDEVLAEGDRALIFTQFAELGKLLQKYLQSTLKQETLLLFGGSTKNQREAMIDRFQNDPQGPRLFILSLKAGGTGLNLTRANHVFHFDRWWNPAVENQATDRVFRIGQTRNVQVHKFVCTGTLEERIHEQLESKKALAEQVVGAGESWLTELDTEQLRSLLLLDRSSVIDEEG